METKREVEVEPSKPLEFMLGSIRCVMRSWESGPLKGLSDGFDVYFASGRYRHAWPGSRLHTSIEELREDEAKSFDPAKEQSIGNAKGTHETIVAYRLADGTISIPPDGGRSQDGGEKIEIRTLRDADRLSAEVAEQQRQRFQDTGEFRERMEEQLGKPTDHLYRQLSNTHSQLEKDVIRHMIEDLNNEQYRQEASPEATAFFHWREYDR